MKIGLDIDGVIYPWHYSIVRYFKEFRNFEGTDYEFWDMFNSLPQSKQDYFVSIPMLYSDTSITEDARDYLPKLAELGELFYITSRAVVLQTLTQKFFDFYQVPFKENLIFEKDKASVVRLLGLDYFVDDISRNLEKVRGITTAFLFRQAHNRDFREGYNTVGSLKEVYHNIIGEQK